MGRPPATRAVLLDVEGVLAISWRPIPGAAEAVAFLRDRGVPFLLATNTTTVTRSQLADRLCSAGIAVGPEEVLTAPVVTGAYLRERHPGARCLVIGGAGALADLGEVEVANGSDADVVVLAGADDDFTWERMNVAFRAILRGAAFVAMHRNLSWTTESGPTLDAGAYVAGLERATGKQAVVVGKPAPEFFRQCVGLLGLEPEEVAMVGDDLENDVLAARSCGLTGVLVKTGKAAPGVPSGGAAGRSDHALESIAELPAWWG